MIFECNVIYSSYNPYSIYFRMVVYGTEIGGVDLLGVPRITALLCWVYVLGLLLLGNFSCNK